MRPLTCADGHDGPWLIDELVPGLAAEGDDFLVGIEDAVGEPVLAHELPDVLDRIELGRPGRQGHEGHVVGHTQLAGEMPSGLIEQQEGVGAGRDMAGNFVDVELHHGGVAAGQDETRPGAASRTDGAEDVG